MTKISAEFRVGKRVIQLNDTLPRTLVDKVLPKGLSKAAPVVKKAIIRKLPDGDRSGTRAKQSEKSKARFPQKMKKNVRIKNVKDESGQLKIIGVSHDAGHVNFDFGEKARTSGRVHKLWWIDGVREKFATPKQRIQTQDIPREVESEVGQQVLNIVEKEVRDAVNRGDLAK